MAMSSMMIPLATTIQQGGDAWVGLMPATFLLLLWWIIRQTRKFTRFKKGGFSGPEEATRCAMENFSMMGMKDWQEATVLPLFKR
jgi:hypothetical protein